ncbi:hypothetical protein [Butyrivibrio sp. NC2002]|uniref:hypothetical protein n=1 Tax=Butyrivibrio sp. NC2002 TaxID=1410610 RepID=UPI0005645F40|nr:hypothetical protein [Butyrivibrio sp. NC2002]
MIKNEVVTVKNGNVVNGSLDFRDMEEMTMYEENRIYEIVDNFETECMIVEAFFDRNGIDLDEISTEEEAKEVYNEYLEEEICMSFEEALEDLEAVSTDDYTDNYKGMLYDMFLRELDRRFDYWDELIDEYELEEKLAYLGYIEYVDDEEEEYAEVV